jgi:periplasmic divalent cation tolerance protein
MFATTLNRREALNIAYTLVEKKLAACVNILNNIESIYEWNNIVQRTAEVLLMIKVIVY